MRRIVIGANAVLAMFLAPVAASAADYAPVPAPVAPIYAVPPPVVPIPVVPLWSGFYIGGNLGGGWAHSPTRFSSSFSSADPVFGSARNFTSGAAGGAQIGYNWQYGGFVFGAESDLQFANGDGQLTAYCPPTRCGVPVAARVEQKMQWFGTSRGRVGYAQDSWLVYFTGGYAYAAFQTDASADVGGTIAHAGENSNRGGWTAGGGIEVAFTRNWSVKAEYLFADFGDKVATWNAPGVSRLANENSLNLNIVRAGVNYRF